MKPSGSKLIMLTAGFSFLLSISFLFSGCFGGVGDWTYDMLPNNYEIVRVNSQAVVFGKRDSGLFNQIMDRHIISFCYNSSYVGMKRIPLDNMEPSRYVDVKNYDPTSLEYYLFDTDREKLYGPYTEKEYVAQCETLSINDMCAWLDTTSKPKTGDSSIS